jgi:hypothetical protein
VNWGSGGCGAVLRSLGGVSWGSVDCSVILWSFDGVVLGSLSVVLGSLSVVLGRFDDVTRGRVILRDFDVVARCSKVVV